MWSYTDEENSWLDAQRDAAGTPATPTGAEVAFYVREGERLRAEAIRQMIGALGRTVRRTARQLFAGLRHRPAGDTPLPSL